MAQLDFGHVLGLHLVDAEANHQVGYDLGFLCGIAHNFNCFIDIQQDSFQAFEQMQALLLALQIVVGAAAHSARKAIHSFRMLRTPSTLG